MSRQEAAAQYAAALKRGRKTYKQCVLHGRYPYPQVLDEILHETMTAGNVDLGVIEIPADRVVGTKTSGRHNVFAADFMPLMESDTEFAAKWMDLCQAHLGEEGIRDPIRCFEYLGRFYIQEGNKRASVLKSYDAPTIPACVTRIVPLWSEEPEIAAYYDFMRAYQLTGLYELMFRRAGSFAKLQAVLGCEPDHVWTKEEQRLFRTGFVTFREAFQKLGGEALPVTAADALLVWLKVYPFDKLRTAAAGETVRSLKAVWADVKALAQDDPIAVTTESQEEPEKPEGKEGGFWSRLLKGRSAKLNIAFINEQLPQQSDWTRAHDLGRQYLEAVMDGQVELQSYDGVGSGAEAEAAMEQAIEKGAQVIFATTPPLIGACRKAAAKHPDVRILNCSVFMPYTGVRTYYSRIYEGKFISGAIAGALCRSGRIGYVASSPIFGVPASINAFALGAQLTNPSVGIALRWSCVEEDAMDALAREGVEFISNRDVPTPERIWEPWGLCQVKDGGFQAMISPFWHWGKVYVRLVHSILGGGWEALGPGQARAVNYWWGMNSGAVGIRTGEGLPSGLVQLADILRQGVVNGSIQPFQRPVRDQSGVLRGSGSRWMSPEEILRMDWLCDCVEGEIPAYESLLPMAKPIVRLQGLCRDQLRPEKEDPIL